jgi:DNA-binding NarL/FixJ family response regulator
MRVLVADDRSKIRFGLRALLRQQPGLEIVGEAAEAEDLLTQVEAVCPDLVLLDWRLQGLAADDLLAALRAACPDLCVIALGGRPEAGRAALAAGADAFVSKADPPERLLAAVRLVQREGATCLKDAEPDPPPRYQTREGRQR